MSTADIPINDSNIQDIKKKEARITGDADLGEVKEVSDEYVITEKVLLIKIDSLFQNLL